MSEAPRPHLSRDLDPLAREFYAQCASGRVCFQRCTACGTWRHQPRFECAACGSAAWEWQASSGRGHVFSWTVTHRAAHPAFASAVPFAVAVVEMEEGVRLVGGLRGLAPNELALDLPVEVVLEPLEDGLAVPFFRPASS